MKIVPRPLQKAYVFSLAGFLAFMGHQLVADEDLEISLESAAIVEEASVEEIIVPELPIVEPAEKVIPRTGCEMVYDFSLESLIPTSVTQELIDQNPRWTEYGRFLRAFRWDQVFSCIEKQYGIEEGILPGLAMQESYGEPLQVREQDGGVGLFMFQPGTAQHYWLYTDGVSDATGQDSAHGERMEDVVEDYNRNYRSLSRVDERFDVRKSAQAAAMYLVELFNRYGNWDEALSAYNEGIPSRNPGESAHVQGVRAFQQTYLQNRRVFAGEAEQSEQLFSFVRVNEENDFVFTYNPDEKDTVETVASMFNQWNDDFGGYFMPARESDVVDSRRRLVGEMPDEVFILVGLP